MTSSCASPETRYAAASAGSGARPYRHRAAYRNRCLISPRASLESHSPCADIGDLMPGQEELIAQIRRQLLDTSGSCQIIRADNSDFHTSSRSDGQLGRTRCHCSGAARMKSSKWPASSWVIDATFSFREPVPGTGIGSLITTR